MSHLATITGEWSHIVLTRAARGCERKFAFDKVKAGFVAERMSAYHGVLFNAYRCLDCGKWHVGHKRDEAGRMIPVGEKVNG